MPTVTTTNDPFMEGIYQGQYHTGLLSNYPAQGIIRSRLAGQIPADVLTNLYQGGAERGYASGMPGSANANAATMRALGLTSYGIQSEGLKDLNDIWRASPQYPLGGSTAQLWTPGLKNTGAPLGGPPPAGAGGGAGGAGGGFGGARAATEPAAPGGGYDTFLADWMKRAGTGGTGSLGVFSPAAGGSLRSFGLPGAETGNIYIGAGAGGGAEPTDYQGPPVEASGGGAGIPGYGSEPGYINFEDPNWLENFLGNYGVQPEPGPADQPWAPASPYTPEYAPPLTQEEILSGDFYF